MRSVCLLLFLLILAQVLHGQAVELPEEIRESLNDSYPGWRLSVLDVEVKEFLEELYPSSQPNLISGDFDGDGQRDFAILIEHSNFKEPDKAFTHVVEQLAFLKRGNGYKKFLLEEYQPADPILYMTLARKGATSHEFLSGKEFKYPTDSIRISYFEKAGGAYIYENGKFRYVTESD